MLKKTLKIFIFVDILFILVNLWRKFIFLDYPVFFLVIAAVWYWGINGKLRKVKIFAKKEWVLLSIIFISFLTRLLGIFYPEHYGLVEQEIYTLPIVASYSGQWLETFKQFTSFETLGLFIQGTFFHLTTYFDFRLFINIFHFLFPKDYFFLNLPSPQIDKWPSWSSDGTYGGLSSYQIDRYALNYFLIRLVSVIFGTLNVFLVYLIAKRFFDKRVALFASLTLGFTFIHVVMSMVGRLYMMTTFFVTLAFLSSWFIAKKGNLASYLLAGATLGIVNAIKITPAVVIPILVAFGLDVFYNQKGESFFKNFFKKLPYLISTVTCSIIVFLISSPILFTDPEHFFGLLQRTLGLFSGEWTWGGNYYSAKVGPPNWLWWLKFMAESGLFFPIFLAAILGIIISFYRISQFKKEIILLFSSVIPYLYLMNTAITRREEFAVLVTPFLAIFSGIFIAQIISFIKKTTYNHRTQQLIIVSSLFFIIGIPALRIFLFDYSINTSDNRTKVANWLSENASKGTFIYFVGPYTQKITLPTDKYLISTEDHLQQNFDYYLATGVDYFVVPANRDLGQFIYHPKEYLNILNNLKLMHYTKSEAEFYKPFFKSGFFSPIITLGDLINENFDGPLQIYKVKKEEPALYPTLQMSPEFILNPPSNVYRSLDKFELVNDQKSIYEKSWFVDQKDAQLTIALRLGRGKYQIIFRIRTDQNFQLKPIALIHLGSNIREKDYGVYYIMGRDFKSTADFQDFNYNLNLTSASILSLDLTSQTEKNIYLESILVKRIE